MKTSIRFPYHQARIWLGLAALLAGLGTTHAQLNIPSDGSDGELKITEGMTTLPDNITQATVTNVVNGITNIVHETVLDLGMAATAAWDANNAANVGKGVYDSNKWAVVFKYTSVTIDEGVRLTFKNHPKRAPVVWLVQSNVVINGTVDLTGQWNGPGDIEWLTPSEPGPGGFRGGALSASGLGSSFGPGGGQGPGNPWGSYRSSYGNPQLLPLIGGSGPSAGGSGGSGSRKTFGGGGALLIAAGDKVTIHEKAAILSNGGHVANRGTGGAIRIVADVILGAGLIDAEPEGRTRIESLLTPSADLRIFPNVANVEPTPTPIIWPPSNTPEVRVYSVDGLGAPSDPSADVGTSSDNRIEKNGPVEILLETRNLPIQGQVRLRVAPKYAGHVWHTATYVSGDINQATWRVTTTLPPGFTVLQARATAP